MSATVHIMIRGKSSFCNYFTKWISDKINREVYITSNEDHQVLLVNARLHLPHAVFIEDYLANGNKDEKDNGAEIYTGSETALLINEIKHLNKLIKVILFTPRNKSAFKNADHVFPIKITEDLEHTITEIITGEKEEKGIHIKEVADWSIFYLTDLEIFEGLIKGKTSQKIAEERHVAKCTIDTERKNLYLKAGIEKNVALLALFGVRNKLIDENGRLTDFFKELKKKAL